MLSDTEHDTINVIISYEATKNYQAGNKQGDSIS